MTSSDKRKFWRVKSDMLVNPEFTNNLPAAPSGPFFTGMPLSSFDKYSLYKGSTLEKGYVWQPHLPDAGIKLDLVDSETVLIPQKVSPLSAVDAKYLNASDGINSKKRRVISDEKPWWLRNTVYLENNLYNQRRPAVKDESQVVTPRHRQDPLSIAAITKTFDNIQNTNTYVDKLKTYGPKGLSIDIEWSIPIFPDFTMITDTPTTIRFDEDLTDIFHKKKQSESIESSPMDAVIMNTRQSLHVTDGSFHASLIAPTTTTTITTAVTSNGHTNGDKSHDNNKNPSSATGEIAYSWISDFKVDIHKKAQDELLFRICDIPTDSNANTTRTTRKDGTNTPQAVQYWNMKKLYDMRKLPIEDWRPLDAVIVRHIPEKTHRNDYEEDEEEDDDDGFTNKNSNKNRMSTNNENGHNNNDSNHRIQVEMSEVNEDEKSYNSE